MSWGQEREDGNAETLDGVPCCSVVEQVTRVSRPGIGPPSRKLVGSIRPYNRTVLGPVPYPQPKQSFFKRPYCSRDQNVRLHRIESARSFHTASNASRLGWIYRCTPLPPLCPWTSSAPPSPSSISPLSPHPFHTTSKFQPKQT